ncbi:MAG: GAF domain-containing sensor histidine kinase [Anaerolineales bacterium]|nr:GAF domain-containing sensor histidine kinase [Anaerolineales bacterium]
MSTLDAHEQHLAVLNRLVEVSLVLNSSLSIDRILTQLMDATTTILEAESASVILRDVNTHELHFLAMPTNSAHSEKLVRIPVPMEGSIAGSIIRESKPIVLNDVTQDPRHYRDADAKSGFQTRSLLGVPMRIKDRVVGALEAVNKIGDHWAENDQFYLEILASQAAIALENAQLVQKLQKANDELAQLDKLKSDFIAIASHELRTPLGVIMGYASFLKEEAKGELSDHATAVLNSALRMRDLIADMTNLRFLNLGESELMREAVSLAQLIDLAKGDTLSVIDTKGHQLSIEMPDEDLALDVDRAKILLAINNILNNAVKFTPTPFGKITVRCTTRTDEVWIQISDNGVGIPQKDLDDIFKAFYQVEDHMTRRHGGMGLGLAIAKSVIEAHGGRIWAESDGPDKGSTFIISLNCSKQEN